MRGRIERAAFRDGQLETETRDLQGGVREQLVGGLERFPPQVKPVVKSVALPPGSLARVAWKQRDESVEAFQDG